MDNPKKHRKHKVKEQRVRSRSRSVADAEESPQVRLNPHCSWLPRARDRVLTACFSSDLQYGRNRAFSAEKDTCSMRNRSSRSSSLSEEPIDARKGLQELVQHASPHPLYELANQADADAYILFSLLFSDAGLTSRAAASRSTRDSIRRSASQVSCSLANNNNTWPGGIEEAQEEGLEIDHSRE